MKHLAAVDASEDRAPALCAWLAARRGDRDAEIRALSENGEGPGGRAVPRTPRRAPSRGRPDPRGRGPAGRVPAIERTRKAYIRLRRRHIPSPTPRSWPTSPNGSVGPSTRPVGVDASAWTWRSRPHAIPPTSAALPRAPPSPRPSVHPSPARDGRQFRSLPHRGRPVSSTMQATPGWPSSRRAAGRAGSYLARHRQRRRRPARLRRRWLARRLLRPGRSVPAPAGPQPIADRLFRNRGDGTFADATDAAGLPTLAGGYGHGVAVGDMDDDGHPDLFVTRCAPMPCSQPRRRHLRGRHRAAGLAGDRDWPTSAAFADLDGDGDLDLYVCHYLVWTWRSSSSAPDPDIRRPLLPAARLPGAQTTCSATTAGFVYITGEAASSTTTAGGSGSSPPTSTRTGELTSTWPTT